MHERQVLLGAGGPLSWVKAVNAKKLIREVFEAFRRIEYPVADMAETLRFALSLAYEYTLG